MATVYLETSFVSACVTDRTDSASLYRRQASLEWWAGPRVRYDLFLSEEVIAELSHPSFKKSREALDHIEEISILPITADAIAVANTLVQERVMPGPVAGDAVHVAIATVNSLDYLLSWNVRHLANPNKVEHLRQVCHQFGLTPPIILTPEMIWEA